MRSTRIVTSFIKNNNKILILKRSEKVRKMKGLWSGVSGIIENNEKPRDRAEIEIFEERVNAIIERDPLWDPKGTRIKA